MKRIIVIGGGIFGAATAFRAAQEGASVTLLEQGKPGGGTSGSSFAWLNASQKPPFSYHALNVAGIGEHLLLARELQDASWLHLDGHAEWAPPGPGTRYLQRKAERLYDWGYPVEVLGPAQFRRLEPNVVLPPSMDHVYVYPMEGYVDAAALIEALCEQARVLRADIRTGVRATAIEALGGGTSVVTTDAEDRLRADAVVICAGPETAEVAGLAGAAIPMANTAGFVVITSPTSVDVRTTITTRDVNLRPAGAGRYCLQAPELDAAIGLDAEADLADEVLDRATAVVPGLAGASVGDAKVAIRPIPSDGLPVVGELPTVPGVYVGTAHSAITLGPLLGRLLAHEVVTGEQDHRLENFTPERPLGLVYD